MVANWPELTLREAGVHLIDCEHRTPPAAQEGYPYVAIPQIKDGRLDLADVRLISKDDFADWTRKAKAQPWDVIVSRRCNPGEAAFVPPDLDCALGQNLVLLRADGEKVLPAFLRWLVRSSAWWDQVRAFINVGAVFDSLKCADIPDFRLPIPSLREQEAIAHILQSLDDKIELNRRMNETLESLTRSLFQKRLVSPIREGLPEGWRKGKVEALATVTRGMIDPGEFPDETFDHFSIPAFDEGRIPTAQTGNTIKSNKFSMVPDCVLLSKLNPRIPRVWLPDLCGAHRAVCSTEFLVVLPRSAISREFLFCFFSNAAFRRVFATLVTGTSGSHQRVTPESLLKMDAVVPAASAIEQFTAAARPLLDRVRYNVRESRTLAALRDALLPKLLSGEIQVKR